MLEKGRLDGSDRRRSLTVPKVIQLDVGLIDSSSPCSPMVVSESSKHNFALRHQIHLNHLSCYRKLSLDEFDSQTLVSKANLLSIIEN